MPPHQRELSRDASAVESRRIRSARAAAAGLKAGLAHQPGDPLTAMPLPTAAQLGVDPRSAGHTLCPRADTGTLRVGTSNAREIAARPSSRGPGDLASGR